MNEKLYVLFFSYGKGKNLIFVAAEETAWYTIAKIAFCSSTEVSRNDKFSLVTG